MLDVLLALGVVFAGIALVYAIFDFSTAGAKSKHQGGSKGATTTVAAAQSAKKKTGDNKKDKQRKAQEQKELDELVALESKIGRAGITKDSDEIIEHGKQRAKTSKKNSKAEATTTVAEKVVAPLTEKQKQAEREKGFNVVENSRKASPSTKSIQAILSESQEPTITKKEALAKKLNQFFKSNDKAAKGDKGRGDRDGVKKDDKKEEKRSNGGQVIGGQRINSVSGDGLWDGRKNWGDE